MENFSAAAQPQKPKPGARGVFSHQDRKKKSVLVALSLGTLLLALGSLVTIAPLVWMVLGSFKSPGEIYSVPQTYVPHEFNFNNYEEALRLVSFAKYFMNSLLICACVVLGQLFISSMAAYSLSKLRVRFAGGILLLFMTSLMVPF